MDSRDFNVRTDVAARNCTRGCTETIKESVLKVEWEKYPLLHWGIEPASVARCSPNEQQIHPHFHGMNGLATSADRSSSAVVSRGNAGWTTSKSGHPWPCQNCSQGPPPNNPIFQGTALNWTEWSSLQKKCLNLCLTVMKTLTLSAAVLIQVVRVCYVMKKARMCCRCVHYITNQPFSARH